MMMTDVKFQNYSRLNLLLQDEKLLDWREFYKERFIFFRVLKLFKPKVLEQIPSSNGAY